MTRRVVDRGCDLAIWEGGVGLLDNARRRLSAVARLEGATFRSVVGDWQGRRVAIVSAKRPRETLAIDGQTLLAIHAGHRPALTLLTAWGRRLPASEPAPAAVWGLEAIADAEGGHAEPLPAPPVDLAGAWAAMRVRSAADPRGSDEVAAPGVRSVAREAAATGLAWGLAVAVDPVGAALPTDRVALWLGRGFAAALRGPQGIAAAVRSQAARAAASERFGHALGSLIVELP
ncbi:MAG: hypothetical protein ACRCT8_14515 [Lacipirellulaceae bacterium]